MNHIQKIVLSSMIALLGFVGFLPSVFAQTASRDELTTRPITTVSRDEQLRRIEEARRFTLQRMDEARILEERASAEIRERRVGSADEATRRQLEVRSETVRRIELNRTDYENALLRFRQAREDFRRDRGNIQARGRVLAEVIGAFIRNAELQKQRVARFEVIDKDLEAALIAALDANIAKLKEFQAQAEAAITREELTAIAVELRQYQMSVPYGKMRKLMLLANVGVYEHRALVIALARADGIAAVLQSLSEQGRNVAALQAHLASAQAEIKSATDKLEALKSKILNEDISDALLSEVRADLQAIQTQIRGVYTTFHDIAVAIGKL